MPRTYHSLGFDLCRRMRWCRNLCTRGKHTRPFSDGIQLYWVGLPQPIWLHLQSSWSHTRTLYLAAFIFIGQLWFMTIKVQNNWLTLDVFYKSCSGGKAVVAKKKKCKCWKMCKSRKECMTWSLEKEQQRLRRQTYSCVFLCPAPPYPAIYGCAKHLCTCVGHVTCRWKPSLIGSVQSLEKRTENKWIKQKTMFCSPVILKKNWILTHMS